ncbi:MAG: metal-dependent transcriptional regulator [Actinomycetota bacterium]|nr:metal-dependent transcriptional regulator [Actinomycetota bacterium]
METRDDGTPVTTNALAERLGVSPAPASAISEELEALIAAKLGDPSVDPHGDPIPTRDGQVEEASTDALDALAPGQAGVFCRVSDADPEMLRYRAERGIRPRATAAPT